MTNLTVKRALLSVANKAELIPFAEALIKLNVEIISTGGTSKVLTQAGILHQTVESLTGAAEMLHGRVKTLHPLVHGGILANRELDKEEAEKKPYKIYRFGGG